MDYASLFFGMSLGCVALGLESHRRLFDRRAGAATALDHAYVAKRKRGRGWTNLLVALMGLLAAVAGLVGAGPIWLSLWAAIPLLLAGVVFMASLDVLRTDRYLRAKLPELERQTLAGNTPDCAASPADQA